MKPMVAFRLDGQPYALPLASVERVVRAVEITPLPKAPPVVLGIVNIGGAIIPVFNIRRRFRLPERDLNLGDHLVVGRVGRRMVAIVVDEASGVVWRPQSAMIPAQEILPGLEGIEGVAKLEDGMILIYDLGKFLSLEEEMALDMALSQSGNVGGTRADE